MRWLQAGHSSLAPPWRMSSTSSSGYWVREGTPELRFTTHVQERYLSNSVTLGTPTEETWPGISSIEEFKSYNFPKYKPQPIINHAPRYWGRVCVCVHMSDRKSYGTFTQAVIRFLPHPNACTFPSAKASCRRRTLLFLFPVGWIAKGWSCCSLSSEWVFISLAQQTHCRAQYGVLAAWVNHNKKCNQSSVLFSSNNLLRPRQYQM